MAPLLPQGIVTRHSMLPAFLASVLSTALAAAGAPEASEFHIVVKPVPGPDGHTVTTLEVAATLSRTSAGPEAALLELAHVRHNVPTSARSIDWLDARDDAGPLALAVSDEGDGDTATRRWFPPRPLQGPVTLRYRVPVDSALAPRGAAPPLELRNEAAAVSGGGAVFVPRPPGGTYRFRIDWDLSALPAGSSAVSSLGSGSVEALPVEILDRVYFMAGDLGRYPDDGQDRGDADFFSAWQGDPPFDAPGLMATARELREQFITFFTAGRTAYGILLRPNPVNPGGGIGLHRSFVVTFGPDTEVEDLQFTLSHEMFHTFQPRLEGNDGPESALEHAWFNEGLAVFYQREFLLRAGLIDSAAYLRDLNTHAARYYTNALGQTPNREVAAGFWSDTRIRTLPYDRGFLYFASVDEAVREASANRRSLDDLVQEMRHRQDRGETPTPGHWEAIVRRELGEEGVKGLHAMLEGAAPLPSSDAFGPCFRRTTKELQRYELGFEPAVLTEPERTVRGLVAGSAAERAGLREGDRILKPVPQDAIQGDQEARLRLDVRREGKDLEITYRPRGETVSAWQWERIAEVPEGRCRSARLP